MQRRSSPAQRSVVLGSEIVDDLSARVERLKLGRLMPLA